MPPALAGFRSVAIAIAAAAALLACSPEEDQRQGAGAVTSTGEGGEAAAGADDGARAEALLVEADQAANLGRDEAARNAYERALAIYRAAGDLSGQGRTLLGLATLARYGGQGVVAREIYADARAMYAQAGDTLGEARVVFAVAELERARFNNPEALAAFSYANEIFREHGEWALEAQALLGIADSERRLHRFFAADGAVARARAIFEIIGDREGQEAAERAWEELLSYVNEYDETRLGLAYDIGYADQAGSRLREAEGYLGLGYLDATAGHPAAARMSFEAARSIFTEMGLANGVFDAWAAQGDMERRLGHEGAARDAYEQALAAYGHVRTAESLEAQEHEETAGSPLAVRAALALIGLGKLDARSGLDAQARLAEARALVPEGSSPHLDGAFLLARGALAGETGRFDEAATALGAAQGTFAEAGLDLGMGEALLAHADLARGQGQTELAVGLYSGALNAFLVARDRIGEGDVRWGLAEALATGAGDTMGANIQYRIAARIFSNLELTERAAAALAAAHALE